MATVGELLDESDESEKELEVELSEFNHVDSKMQNDDVAWISELKKSLLSTCDIVTVQRICNYNPVPDCFRVDIWKICLNIKKKEAVAIWDEIFDLPEQTLIRQDSQNLADRLGNEEEDKPAVISDIESVITKFCKATNQTYSSKLKWLEILQPIVALHLEKTDVYSLFSAIHVKYIHRNLAETYSPFHLFRLLLLYHDPELCLFLDTKKISPDLYAFDWFASLFSSTCSLKCIQMMWDIYFQYDSPFLIYFLTLVFIINIREKLLECKNLDKQSIIDLISSLPCNLEVDDVKDFCSLASLFSASTPHSFRSIYHSLLFQNPNDLFLSRTLSQALCLPVSAQDLILKSQGAYKVRFFIVDCRPAEQYNSGHLPTASHLDASLMLQEPAVFSTAVDALLAAKDQAVAANSTVVGEQICFMGSGREEEDQYVHMVIASFLQKHQKYVSLAYGGYAALHDLVESNLDSFLTDHCSKTCLSCNMKSKSYNGITEKENSIFDKLATVVKNRGVVVKEKLAEYILNPQAPEDRHVSSNDRLGKRYRGIPPTFSIDGEHEMNESSEAEEETYEEVSVETWKNKSDVIGAFECDEFTDSGMTHPSHLIITDTHMYILRLIPMRKGNAFIIARRPLINIVKITSKRRCPEFITFKHGTSDDSDIVIATDHLLIPKAGDATRLIKYHIYKKTNVLETK